MIKSVHCFYDLDFYAFMRGRNSNHNVTYIHACHSHFIPKGVAEASQIFLRDAHVLPFYLAMRNTAEMIGGKSIV
jgi:hypothetical protein